MSGWTNHVLIRYFIAAQPPHGHDDPFTLVFALYDFASYTFFLDFTPISTERSYLSCFTLIFLLDTLSNRQT